MESLGKAQDSEGNDQTIRMSEVDDLRTRMAAMAIDLESRNKTIEDLNEKNKYQREVIEKLRDKLPTRKAELVELAMVELKMSRQAAMEQPIPQLRLMIKESRDNQDVDKTARLKVSGLTTRTKKPELQQMCRDRGLDPEGLSAELYRRIVEFEKGKSKEAETTTRTERGTRSDKGLPRGRRAVKRESETEIQPTFMDTSPANGLVEVQPANQQDRDAWEKVEQARKASLPPSGDESEDSQEDPPWLMFLDALEGELSGFMNRLDNRQMRKYMRALREVTTKEEFTEKTNKFVIKEKIDLKAPMP
jgi:hypothetical protein